MRKLYHFESSPFSRRTRLALVHKGLPHDLLEGRGEPPAADDPRKSWPLRTIPVLVAEDGHVIGDSTAIRPRGGGGRGSGGRRAQPDRRHRDALLRAPQPPGVAGGAAGADGAGA